MKTSFGRRLLLALGAIAISATACAAPSDDAASDSAEIIKEPEPAPARETPHFVHVFFSGGLNALFAGEADRFAASGAFGVTATNIKGLGNGVFTDAATFGQLPTFALQHWAAVGIKHGATGHTTSETRDEGGEHALLFDGSDSYLNELAFRIGGGRALSAVDVGAHYAGYLQPKPFNGVSLQRVTDLHALTNAMGWSGDKEAEVEQAYGLNGSVVGTFAARLAGAEMAIRGAGTSVVNVSDGGLAPWDFHQLDDAGRSLDGTLAREKLVREGRIDALRTFLDRMLNLPDRNVVVCLSGDYVRLPNGEHGDGTVAVLMGKNVKQGLSFPVDAQARFAPNTPGVRAFWAAAAAALGVEGEPFGPNPHRITLSKDAYAQR